MFWTEGLLEHCPLQDPWVGIHVGLQNVVLGCMRSSAPFLHSFQGASDAPTKVFDRTPNLVGAQIISYRVSPDAKWAVLIGIAPGAPERYVHGIVLVCS